MNTKGHVMKSRNIASIGSAKNGPVRMQLSPLLPVGRIFNWQTGVKCKEE